MELLLNLLWLTLALPAIWMGRHPSLYTQGCRGFDRIRPFVLFACGLLLLFPVVSATDDLCATQQIMEEFGPSKRMVKAAVGDKLLTRHSSALPAFVLTGACSSIDDVCGQVLLAAVRRPEARRFGKPSSRAPPFSRPCIDVRFAA
jgi:hypothetical protein